MSRFSTLCIDRLILTELLKGHTPKRIAVKLELSSVWVVYNAIRRNRSTWKNKIEQRTAKAKMG